MNHFNLLSGTKFRQALLLSLFLVIIIHAAAQDQERAKSLELYGQLVTDIGYNFGQIDPDWFDVLRVSKLPQYKDQFAPAGKIFFSVRQTLLGIKSASQTPLGQLKTNFEFDLFGSGPDVGQTTFHLRLANAELGRFLAGYTLSLFSDADVSPNILDYGAPSSRAFLRNIMVRYMHAGEHNRWAVALERPGATSDEGIYANRIELQNVRAQFKLPDLTAEYRRIMQSGYIELASVLKWIRWKNTVSSPIDLSGNEIGWGFNISATQHLSRNTLFKGQFVYGSGIENHLTDATFDIGIKNNFADPTTPVLGVALPVTGALAFLEHKWNNKWSSTTGYSRVHIYNSEAQAGNAFKNGDYAILNLLYHPFSQFLMGAELQWGKRKNFHDGFSASAVKVQFSFRYNFSQPLFEQVNK